MHRRPRWVLTITVVVVAIGVWVWSTWFDGPPEKCKPVLDFLDFSRSQAAKIDSKGNEGVPTVAEDAAYQQWADGLAERSQKVTDPALAAQTTEVAQLANQFVAGLPTLRAQTQSRAPGAPAPPQVYEMSLLNDRIVAKLGELRQTCS
jgi:cell division septation protein DedD